RGICALRRAAPAHRPDAVGSRLHQHQGALPRNLPARGTQGMKRLQPLLPFVGVAVLLTVWSLTVWARVVDPVLLPSPASTFRAMWIGVTTGKLGADFLKTIERTISSTAIAAVIAIPLGILLG